MAEKKTPTRKAPAKRKPPAKKKPSATPVKRAAGKRAARSSAKAQTSAAAKKKADEAAERAKQEKATGARLTAAKMQLRDSMIVARKAQGLTAEAIAAEADVSTRTVERVLRDRRGIRSPLEETPMQLLEELATGLRLSIGDYESMALAWFEVNQSASLGAKKAADETRARLAALLAEVGKLPTDLEVFRSEMQMQRIAEEMVRVMRAVAAGEMDASEAVEFFRGLIAKREQLPEAA